MFKKLSGPFGFFERARARTRVYVLPTGPGVALLALILALIFMSAVYASPSLQFLGFFLFALFTLSFAWTHSHLRRLEKISFSPAPGHAGEGGAVRLRAWSGSSDERQGLEVKLHLRAPGRKPVTLTTAPFTLEQDGEVDRELPLPLPLARGRWRVRRTTIGTSAPFGLATAWMSVAGGGDYFVYPRRREVFLSSRPAEVGGGAEGFSVGDETFDRLTESPWMTSALHVVPKPAADESLIVVKKFAGAADGAPVLEWEELPPGFEDRVSRCAEALARAEPGAALELRTPIFRGTVRTAEERRRALELFAEARP